MNIGDIVVPKHIDLTSGSWRYQMAVAVSVRPLILVSVEADMTWRKIGRPSDFKIIGASNKETLDKCLARYWK